MTLLNDDELDRPTLLIFGYGSLIWNPGFRFDDCWPAFASGYARRMYQGNIYHRGDENMPGRVATLVEDKSAATSGVVFCISGLAKIATALRHLHEREICNGYDFAEITVSILPQQDACQLPGPGESLKTIGTSIALTCIARPDNEFYLGPATTRELAEQISVARGYAGPNCEYLFKLADNIRRIFPDHIDEHITQLELNVRQMKH